MKNLMLTAAVIACLSLMACSSDEMDEPVKTQNVTSAQLLENEGFLKVGDTLNEGDNGDVTNPRPRN